MKRTGKTVLCALLLLAALWGLMTAAAAVKGDDDMAHGKGLAYDVKTFDVTEAFSNIRVEDVECNVRILRASDGRCKVVCQERRDGSIRHTVTVSSGELSVQRHDRRKWYQRFGVSLDIPDVEVYLPENAYGMLTCYSTAGSIQVDEGFTFDRVSLKSTSGSVRMLSDAKDELQAESISGSVDIENASPETLVAKSTSGRVLLSHIRCGELSARTTAGAIELTDAIAEKRLYAKSVSGGVSLDGCDSGAIRIATISGTVKGTILSGKIFMTDSTSGSVSIPASAAGGECEITTTSGSIVLDIRQ